MDTSLTNTFANERELHQSTVIKTAFITAVMNEESKLKRKLNTDEIKKIYDRVFSLYFTFSDCINNHLSSLDDHKEWNSFDDC